MCGFNCKNIPVDNGVIGVGYRTTERRDGLFSAEIFIIGSVQAFSGFKRIEAKGEGPNKEAAICNAFANAYEGVEAVAAEKETETQRVVAVESPDTLVSVLAKTYGIPVSGNGVYPVVIPL
jgi:hypothetical protein